LMVKQVRAKYKYSFKSLGKVRLFSFVENEKL
jgi:hypothetical protein